MNREEDACVDKLEDAYPEVTTACPFCGFSYGRSIESKYHAEHCDLRGDSPNEHDMRIKEQRFRDRHREIIGAYFAYSNKKELEQFE